MIADKIHNRDYHISKEVPTLVDIATTIVAQNFQIYPQLSGLDDPYLRDQLINQVSIDLPITITAPFIDQENYWKRACEKRWKNVRPYGHGNSWKHAFLERYIQELIQKFPAGADIDPLFQMIIAARPYIFSLHIEELPSHLDLRILFKTIPTLARLSITYGAKHLGADYDRTLFGMTMEDAASLAKCIKNAQSLLYLSIPCNQIDDETVRMLARGLMVNKTIIELDLSHNRIGDHGARRLARYLFHNQTLQILDLNDNQIQFDGSRCIGQAIRNNDSLRVLNLKHNRIDDKAGAKLCNDLYKNQTLEVLNLSANQLSTLFCDKFTELIQEHPSLSLREIDISSNFLVDPDAEDVILEEMTQSVEQLYDALQVNCPLMKIDIRNNSIQRKLEKAIMETVVQKELSTRGIPFVRSKTPASSIASRENSRQSSRHSGKKEQETPRSPS